MTYNILDRGNSIAAGAIDIERGSSAVYKNCFRIVKQNPMAPSGRGGKVTLLSEIFRAIVLEL